MDKEDGRKLSRQAQHERRKQAVRLHRRGLPFKDIAAALSMSQNTVRQAVKVAQAEGMRALAPKPTGRSVEQKRRLAAEQEVHIQRLICQRRPEQLKLSFALWTRAAVLQWVQQELGIELPICTMGEYLKRWGFTPQKPITRAYEKRSEAVRKWLDEEYPEIPQRAKREGAEIHWGDETAVVNTDVRGCGYQPKGQTPVAYAVGGTRQKLSMISTVTNQGKTRWMIIEEAFNSDRLIEFLSALIKDSDKKVFLILDNLRAHHSKPVKAWQAEHKERVEVFYLPSYNPELNPDERLNIDLKQTLGSRVQLRTKDKLKKATNRHMEMVEQNPERVMSYFQDPRVKNMSLNINP
ncbi:MAG: IS630 family transposase [Betaproteobacteria bacterium]|nr:IS630 family transposase [Betaproteobacteria bacterium]